METYKGKTVVITGAATGIGFALAREFGSEGARIVIGEPREARLEEAVSALEAAGIEVAAKVLDVREPASMEAFADFAWETFGAVHLLINNAGVGVGLKRVSELPLEALHQVFDVNVFGVWHGCAIFGPRMVAQGGPVAIYNVGSENSFFNAMPRMAAYIASKHAVRGLTEALREEMPEQVTVGLICPGLVQSEMTASGPLGEAAMAAETFAGKVREQISAGQFYVVTHPYNIERIGPIHAEIEAAYAEHAPRYAGDEEHDVRLLAAKIRGG
ncbi:MAG: SDR family NAD(P)-dependent oxidoreductase [Pseudomonadota bacterium]